MTATELEVILVAGILAFDILQYIDSKKTNKYQRWYWQERADFYARRLKQPPKIKKPKPQQPIVAETLPETKQPAEGIKS